jgi:glycerol-3-phosphate acyltransferase PlsY
VLATLLSLAFGYLLGSIPFGLLLTKARRHAGHPLHRLGQYRRDQCAAHRAQGARGGDLAARRAEGDGRGADRRTLGRRSRIFAGAGAFLGHLFPVWLGFKGGKGVATFHRLPARRAWPTALVFAVVWLATAFTTKYSSAGALVASVVAPIALLFMGQPTAALVFAALAALLWWKHSENIARLRRRNRGQDRPEGMSAPVGSTTASFSIGCG